MVVHKSVAAHGITADAGMGSFTNPLPHMGTRLRAGSDAFTWRERGPGGG